MDNLELYNKVSEVPKTAQREIQAGRLKGKTDINPMWRIKTLTEQFGVCGFGWYPEITKQWIEIGANGEQSAFVNINLYVKKDDEWSKPINATGGSSFVSSEKNGLYTSDECFKMAYTDALSVACKLLGFGANIYWNADNTKYDKKPEQVVPFKDLEKPLIEQAKEYKILRQDGSEVLLNSLTDEQLNKVVELYKDTDKRHILAMELLKERVKNLVNERIENADTE